MKIINIERLKAFETECLQYNNNKTLDVVMEMVRTFSYSQIDDAGYAIMINTLNNYGLIVDIESEEKKPIVSPHNFGG